MEASEEVMKHLNEALEYALENKAALGATMEAGLLELLKEESGKSGLVGDDVLTREEIAQLVEHVSESMKNHIRMLAGKKNRFRFSPYLMGLSMNLYLQSGTSAYDQMQADSVIIMPRSSTLAKLKQAQKIRAGDCPVMYEKRMLTREFREEIGELICDEMKLKQDVVMNVNSDTVIGFTEDFICHKKY